MNKTIRVLTQLGLKITYTIILLYLVLFTPKRLAHQVVSSAKIIPFKNTVKMVVSPYPGADWKYWLEFWLNLFGNIALFIPFGFWMFGCIAAGKMKSGLFIVVLGALASFAIEFCQWKFRLGVFDVDDIILNTIGSGVGILCFKIYCKRFYLQNK